MPKKVIFSGKSPDTFFDIGGRSLNLYDVKIWSICCKKASYGITALQCRRALWLWRKKVVIQHCCNVVSILNLSNQGMNLRSYLGPLGPHVGYRWVRLGLRTSKNIGSGSGTGSGRFQNRFSGSRTFCSIVAHPGHLRMW